MGAFVLDAADRAQPRGRSRADRGGLLRRRPPAGPPGLQHRAHHRAALRAAAACASTAPPCRATALPASRRSARPPTRSKPGRATPTSPPASSGCRATTRPSRAPAPQDQNEQLQGRERAARRLHLDGHDGGERRRALRGQPRRHGQVRPALAGAGRAVPGERLLRPRDRAGHAARRHDGRQGRRPARQLDAREAVRSWTPPSRRAARSRRATRVRSTTARPPCS